METVYQELLQMITSPICRHGLLPMGLVLQFFGFEWGRKVNENLYIAHQNIKNPHKALHVHSVYM